MYIPFTAFDTAQIRFAGSAAEVETQQVAFDRFIDGDACLQRQRGAIMTRNSCRSPWMSLVNVAIRQALPARSGQSAALEVQVFNVLNLLSPRWGRIDIPTGASLTNSNQIALLSQVGETAGGGPAAQPVYRFDSTMARYSSQNIDTYYQIQLAARYSF